MAGVTIALVGSAIAILAIHIVLHISGYYYNADAEEYKRKCQAEPCKTPRALYCTRHGEEN